MTGLYIFLGIVLFFSLVLSLRAKIFVKLNGELTVRAGLGPVILKLVPKKEKKIKKPRLSAFSYKKHMKRLAREAEKKSEKAAKKTLKKEKKLHKKKNAVSRKAEETEEKSKKTIAEKIHGALDVVRFVLDEFPRLASYIRTDVRILRITVASDDAAKTAEIYGGICAGTAALLEILSCRTKMRRCGKNSVAVNADFLGEKTVAEIDIRMSISLFSVLRVGIHTLAWLIKQKIK